MASIELRTADELKRAEWAEKYTSVAEGDLYHGGHLSPFPIHEYFKLGLLGKEIRMVEMNAGHALVEHMVADTLTEMTITIGDGTDTTQEQESRVWMEQIDYDSILEEAARDFYANGYCVEQPFRTVDGDKTDFTVANLDPSTWYPDIPTFIQQPVTSGRIISVFSITEGTAVQWYALVERHTIGQIAYELYKLDKPDALEGTKILLTDLPRFDDMNDVVKTDLDYLAVFQQNRQKKSRDSFGQSVFKPIWGPLQEISELQTQIRQERIKHFRSRMAVPIRSLQRVGYDEDGEGNFKTEEREKAAFNMNQEVFPIPEGSTVLPSYIQWDMAIIKAGSDEIDKLHARCAAYSGFPKSVFNLDESAGNVKVDTEKRKNVRYVRRIMQGQRRMASLVRDVLLTRYKWLKMEVPKVLKVQFANPFDMTQEEVVALMREMNPNADFVSRKEALKQIWKNKKPEELDQLLSDIDEEQQASIPPSSALNNPAKIQL
jgi:hypothetical protein